MVGGGACAPAATVVEPDEPPTQTRQLVRQRDPVCLDDGPQLPRRTVRRVEAGGVMEEPAADLTVVLGESFLIPVAEPEVTSHFGMRSDPINPSRRRMHRGVDLRGATGTPVLATASGRALMAGYCDRGTGNCVVIEHAHGWRSQYFHLDEVHIRAGQAVSQGDRIGDIGATGRATGPHLHFQLGREGAAEDPMPLMGQPLNAPAGGEVAGP